MPVASASESRGKPSAPHAPREATGNEAAGAPGTNAPEAPETERGLLERTCRWRANTSPDPQSANQRKTLQAARVG